VSFFFLLKLRLEDEQVLRRGMVFKIVFNPQNLEGKCAEKE
jgi:hypothetical protein